jgi:hypothetical protein
VSLRAKRVLCVLRAHHTLRRTANTPCTTAANPLTVRVLQPAHAAIEEIFAWGEKMAIPWRGASGTGARM